MELKDVTLDPFLISGLFKNSLVEKSIPTSKSSENLQVIPSLGNNKKNWLLLISNNQEAFVKEDIFNMLNKLLQACQMTLDDVVLVNVAHFPEYDFNSLSRQFAPQKIILFGHVLPELIQGHHKNKIWGKDGCYFLHTDELKDMLQDPTLKVPFWNELKELLKK